MSPEGLKPSPYPTLKVKTPGFPMATPNFCSTASFSLLVLLPSSRLLRLQIPLAQGHILLLLVCLYNSPCPQGLPLVLHMSSIVVFTHAVGGSANSAEGVGVHPRGKALVTRLCFPAEWEGLGDMPVQPLS